MTQGFAVTTLDELGQRLRVVAAGFSARDDRQAYFAALYGLMTGRVADGVAAGRFTDGVRMERLACHFASRYLSALDAFDRAADAPASWTLARDAAASWRPIILQHLMLGMNAHINFDLGIAAADVAGGDGLQAVKQDFDEINLVLAELLGDVQRCLGQVSPWMAILDAVGGRKDEKIVNFSMRRARDAAWEVAERFSGLSGDARRDAEGALDGRVARFAGVILRPGYLLSAAAIPVRLRERASVAEVVDAFSVVEGTAGRV